MPFRWRFYKVIMARHSCFIKGNLIFIQIWPWMSMIWCTGPSGPFSMHGVKTNWHFALSLHWFAKLLAWNTKIYPVLFPKRGWHFCCSSAFSFAPEEQRTGGSFSLLTPLYLYCTSLLSKQCVDECSCLLNGISTEACSNVKSFCLGFAGTEVLSQYQMWHFRSYYVS